MPIHFFTLEADRAYFQRPAKTAIFVYDFQSCL